MHRSSENNRRWHVGLGVGALLGSVSVVGLLAAGMVPAKADDVTIKEIKELRAQLRRLEHKVDNQGRVIRREAAYPVTKGPYEPPQPWDKKFHLGGITITPTGFFQFVGAWHDHDLNSVYDEPYGSYPDFNSAGAHTQETRFSAQTSRFGADVEGAINPSTTIDGYIEVDFLGGSSGANDCESTSYVPRMRQAYVHVDWKDIGFEAEAGQTWSLATFGVRGLKVGGVDLEPTIDTAIGVGTVWTRQPGVRIIKHLTNEFTVALGVEQSQTSGCTTADVPVPGGEVLCAATQGTNANPVANFSFNHIPDVIAKVAWDPVLAGHAVHAEAYGMYVDAYDSVTYGGGTSAVLYTNDTAGWGAGGALKVAVLPHLLDVQGNALIGRGIGRYGASQLADVTVNPDGALDPLPTLIYQAGAILHATPDIDLYAFYGQERILNADDFYGTYGYSPTTADNSGCFYVGGICEGKTESTWQITGGAWDKVYDGAFGSLKLGVQYSYNVHTIFAGTGTDATYGGPYVGSPSFAENSIYATVVYFPFTAPPPAPALVSKY